MSWATPYIAQLREGKTVQFRPRGNSMRPKIESGALCTVEPVLCKVGGAQYLHFITGRLVRVEP